MTQLSMDAVLDDQDSLVADPTTANRLVKFGGHSDFQHCLTARVNEYFAQTGLSPNDCVSMYVKTAIILVWLGASYLLLLAFAATWWLAVPCAVSLGLAMAAVGFNIQHDGGHRAYSRRPWVNKLMGLTLDLLGGSSYVWARKHNSVHHSYSNITGHDDDINIGFFGRLSPHQQQLKVHRWQHYYLWFLYGFLPLKWQLYDDFRDVALARVGIHHLARPKGWDLFNFIAGKVLFFALALGIPLMWHSVGTVLLYYFLASFVQGIALSVVFQMAHCVEEAEFPMPDTATGRIDSAWAIHQVQTTVNFARNNRALSWFVGGLNYQIEHHLFPRICHIHYRAISGVVEKTCEEFGIPYREHATFRAGLASHFRWLRRMGS